MISNLPTSWDLVYIDQFIELKKLDGNESSFFANQTEKLAILTDTLSTDEVWEDMDVEELSEMIESIHWLKSEPTNQYKKVIGDLTYIGVNKLTLGEFIDLDIYFEDYYTNLFKICAVLYRKTKLDEWGNTLFEPYGIFDIEKRVKLFEELPITSVYGVLGEFLSFKKTLLDNYGSHFEQIGTEEEGVEYDADELAEIEKEKVYANWAWESLIDNLTDGDVTKMDAVTNLPVIFVFNRLSYIKDMKS